MEKLNKKGFTLAELMVVLGILAVLVSIAVPVYNNQFENARAQVDTANIRSCVSIATADAMLNAKGYALLRYEFDVTTAYDAGEDGNSTVAVKIHNGAAVPITVASGSDIATVAASELTKKSSGTLMGQSADRLNKTPVVLIDANGTVYSDWVDKN